MAKIRFLEDGHKYLDEKDKQYTSVTTVISEYKSPFDEEYWSLYKAIERYVNEKKGLGYFDMRKKQVGYENIIPYFTPYIGDKEYLEKLRKDIIGEWDAKREKSAKEGTAFHKEKEDETNSAIFCPKTGLRVIREEERDFHDLKDGVYAELVVWDEEYEIAGQADKVIKDNGFVDIDDYKTSEKIDSISFKHYIRGYEMMNYPLDNIMNCNKMHYTIQLSTYGYLLERKGSKVRRLRILHTKSNTWIEVPYLRDEVIAMLEHFKKNGKKQTKKKK